MKKFYLFVILLIVILCSFTSIKFIYNLKTTSIKINNYVSFKSINENSKYSLKITINKNELKSFLLKKHKNEENINSFINSITFTKNLSGYQNKGTIIKITDCFYDLNLAKKLNISITFTPEIIELK